MKRFFTIVLSFVLMAGCATGYQKNSLMGGYSDSKLQDDVYRISFRGNGYTDGEKAGDFTLLRAAEVTLENGYQYFIALEAGRDDKVDLYTTPMQANTVGNINTIGNTGYYNGNTTFSGGDAMIIRRPKGTMTIQCFREKPDTDAFVLDATQIRDNIKAKYGIK